MSPPRKDMIPDQDINMLGTEKDQSLPPKLAKFCPVYKSLINEAKDGRNDYTDTSRTYKEDSVKNTKSINKKLLMTNTKIVIHDIIKVMEVLFKKLNKKNHLLNG